MKVNTAYGNLSVQQQSDTYHEYMEPNSTLQEHEYDYIND